MLYETSTLLQKLEHGIGNACKVEISVDGYGLRIMFRWPNVKMGRFLTFEELDAIRMSGEMYVNYLIEETKQRYEEYILGRL